MFPGKSIFGKKGTAWNSMEKLHIQFNIISWNRVLSPHNWILVRKIKLVFKFRFYLLFLNLTYITVKFHLCFYILERARIEYFCVDHHFSLYMRMHCIGWHNGFFSFMNWFNMSIFIEKILQCSHYIWMFFFFMNWYPVCLFRSLVWENFALQSLHLNGFFFFMNWYAVCLFTSLVWENSELQTLNLSGFFSLWTEFICLYRYLY